MTDAAAPARRQKPMHHVLQHAMIDRDWRPTGNRLWEELQSRYPGLRTTRGNLSDLLTGKVRNPQPRVIVPVLHLLGLTPEDIGMTPETHWDAWMLYQGMLSNDWPVSHQQKGISSPNSAIPAQGTLLRASHAA